MRFSPLPEFGEGAGGWGQETILSEIYTLSEGALYYAQASAAGQNPYTAWATGADAPTGLFAYVRSLSYTSAQTLVTIKDRGVPTHHKRVGRDEIEVVATIGWTGAHPEFSAYNASVGMGHLEYKLLAAGQTAYAHFYGVAEDSLEYTEADEENTMQMTFRALGMNLTGSGYVG
jgi:hypothetical protein